MLLVALEDGDAAEEEREERVEARPLDGVVLDLLCQLARRSRVAPGGRVGLALGVQARVGRCAVHRRGGDELAVRVGNEHRNRLGGLGDDEVDDGTVRARVFMPGILADSKLLHTRVKLASVDERPRRAGRRRPVALDPRHAYPVVLPKLSDPRLHLAVVITTLQVLGQVAFHFRLSIAQILVLLDVRGARGRDHVPEAEGARSGPRAPCSPGTAWRSSSACRARVHGDWWSLHGWWIYVGTAAVSLLSKYVIRWRGGHIFNPSNFGLVLCFLVLGRTRAEPLDFWWGADVAVARARVRRDRHRRPRDPLAAPPASGRRRLLGVVRDRHRRARRGRPRDDGALASRPDRGRNFWWVLVTSPEVLVFLFFMLTDPKTSPKGRTRAGRLRSERRVARQPC